MCPLRQDYSLKKVEFSIKRKKEKKNNKFCLQRSKKEINFFFYFNFVFYLATFNLRKKEIGQKIWPQFDQND